MASNVVDVVSTYLAGNKKSRNHLKRTNKSKKIHKKKLSIRQIKNKSKFNKTNKNNKVITYNLAGFRSDTVLVVNINTEYRVHGRILSKSQVFKTMLDDIWTNGKVPRKIQLVETNLCQELFPQFLNYLYGDEMTLTFETLMGIATLSEKYIVEDLSTNCERYVLRNVHKLIGNPWLLVSLMTYFQRFPSRTFYENFKTFAVHNFRKIFIDCNPAVPFEVLSDVMSCSDIVIEGEFDLFLFLERLLMQISSYGNGVQRENKSVNRMLSFIRFHHLTDDQVARVLRSPLVDYFDVEMYRTVTEGLRRRVGITEENDKDFDYRNYNGANFCACIKFVVNKESFRSSGSGNVNANYKMKCVKNPKFATFDRDFDRELHWTFNAKFRKPLGLKVTVRLDTVGIAETCQKIKVFKVNRFDGSDFVAEVISHNFKFSSNRKVEINPYPSDAEAQKYLIDNGYYECFFIILNAKTDECVEWG